jgi:mycothiol synthase
MESLHNQKPQLVMFRPTLAKLPDLQLPEGYSIRKFQPGDEEAWEYIINHSFKYKSNFDKEIKSHKCFSPERVIFVCHKNTPVATATAWHRPLWGEHTGYLHMVGALSSHSGKGLGLQASLAALYQMKNEGKLASILETDDFRLPAIKTYLKLGYKPLLIHENQGARWDRIFNIIGGIKKEEV